METRDQFVESRRARWEELDRLTVGRDLSKLDGPEISRLAALYRALSNDLMRARSLGIGADITTYLDVLAGRVHSFLYAPRPWRLGAIWDLVRRGFPRALRKNWRFFATSSALFYLPFAFGLYMTIATPEFAHSVVPGAM